MKEVDIGKYDDGKRFVLGLEHVTHIGLRVPKEGTICGYFTAYAGIDPDSGKYIYSNTVGFTPVVASLNQQTMIIIGTILRIINSKIDNNEILTMDSIIQTIEEIEWEEEFQDV